MGNKMSRTSELLARFFNAFSSRRHAAVSSNKTSTPDGATFLGEQKAPSIAPSDISVTVTSANQKLADGGKIKWVKMVDRTNYTLLLNPAKQYQKIVGFGAAFTDSACYMFNKLSESALVRLFNNLFGADGLALNLCRTCMGASDYATHVYSYCDGEADPELKNFNIDHDKKYILPMLRRARAINPELFLLATPWSPPGWMKANGSMLGGNMQRRSLGVYAQYFLKFLQAYAGEGVPVQAVTVQNEVDTDQDGKMPACPWPQELEVDFVRWFLGPLLEKEGVDTQIWVIDHNTNLWGRALATLGEDTVKKYVKALAWHTYMGDKSKMTLVHDAHPDIDAYWTEGGSDVTNADYYTDWAKWGTNFTDNLRNWCRGLTAWNLALDENGKPTIGPFPCGGLVTINSQTLEVTYSGIYYGLAHFSKFIRREAKRFDSSGDFQKLSHVAFENSDGEKVLVLTNSGEARTVRLQLGEYVADVALAADSIATLTWNSKPQDRKIAFPKDFVWGSGTSAYQIEGAWDTDGKGESIWDRFSHTKGKVHNDENGDIACDHFHRFEEDIKLAKKLNLTAYRFSISWPRVQPLGRGDWNEKGMEFYDRLIDCIIENGLEPFVTLYHWDLPQALQEELGGWASREVLELFAAYSGKMTERYSDRIKFWATFNEPWCSAYLGYAYGAHAPGLNDPALASQVAHNLLVAHGLATVAIRKAAKQAVQVGIVLNMSTPEPLRPDNADDVAAAEKDWHWSLGKWVQPLLRGTYPDDVAADIGDIQPGDLATIHQPIDYVGINYYFPNLDSVVPVNHPLPGYEYTAMPWAISPSSLGTLIRRIAKEYPDHPTLYITENGAAFDDEVNANGEIDDPKRTKYLNGHIQAVALCVQEGINVMGYFAWSLMDNFEWAYGYDKRFGVIHVDYATQKRTIKNSGKWLANIAAQNAIEIDETAKG
ncbi:MAG: GH1 family beta-glucosidase [Candidatus Obscuribacterales bacterium]|nr:GH1 family beta-glucosidase [Candidatus Obscuribacterales bacterium]